MNETKESKSIKQQNSHRGKLTIIEKSISKKPT